MKIERLYSDYQEEERLYSTGNDELDDLLERAFCDGYEYAQREFAALPGLKPSTQFKKSLKKAPIRYVGVFPNPNRSEIGKKILAAPKRNVGIFGQSPKPEAISPMKINQGPLELTV